MPRTGKKKRISRGGSFLAAESVLLALAVLGMGCASYKTTAKEAQPSEVVQEGGWTIVPRFPLVLQRGTKDCGAAALSAVASYWGIPTSPETVERFAGHPGERLSAGDLERFAKSAGLSSFVFYGTMNDIVYEVQRGRPVLVGVGKVVEPKKALSHYEVVVGFEPKKRLVLLLDPGRGWQVDTFDRFAQEWAMSKGVTLVAFLPRSDANG